MIQVRKAASATDGSTLQQTFSFGEYHDPTRLDFRSPRVSNDDWVRFGQGFLRGSVNFPGNGLSTGDGVAITDENAVSVQAAVPSEVLLFDLA
jgi:redox-sensitive bicupin YhaK (pirin superfamily)